MPPGAPRTPRAVPRRLPGPRPFPEGEVHRVFFVLVHLHPGPRDHSIQATATQLTVSRAPVHPEVYVAAGRVSVLFIHQVCDGIDDGGDLLGGPGVDVGALHVQSVHGPEEFSDVLFGQFFNADTPFLSPLNYFVVDVGEILDVTDLVTQMLKVAAQYVKDYIAERVSHMGVGVGSHPTNVHLDGLTVGGNEVLRLTGKRIV